MPSVERENRAQESSLHFEVERIEDHSKHLIRSRPEIVALLYSLIKAEVTVELYFNQKMSSLHTSMLTLVDDDRAFVLDAHYDEQMNEDLAQARDVILTANNEDVKIQFMLDRIAPISYGSLPAFLCPVPDALLRVQRRDFNRLSTIEESISCTAMIKKASGRPKRTELRVSDISAGGIGLVTTVEDAQFIEEKSLLDDCSITLPGEAPFVVSLRVRHLARTTTIGGAQRVRIGCEYVGLPEERLKALRACIERIERERENWCQFDVGSVA